MQNIQGEGLMDDHSALLYCSKHTQHGERLDVCSLPTSPPRGQLRFCLRRQGPTIQQQKKANHWMARLCCPRCPLMPPRACTALQASRHSTTAWPSSSAASCGAARSSTPWPSVRCAGHDERTVQVCHAQKCFVFSESVCVSRL